MSSYEIKRNAGDSHQISPYWLAAIVSFKNPLTIDRSKLFNSPFVISSQKSLDNPVEEYTDEGEIFLIDNDCVQWQISTSKSSHVAICSLELMHSSTDYLARFSSGDWLLFWAFDNKSDYLRIKSKLSGNGEGENKYRCNKFEDGFKFLGRIASIRKTKTRSVSGALTTRFNILANGFHELDASIYCNPVIMTQYQQRGVGQWMLDFTGNYAKLFGSDTDKTFNSQYIIPRLFWILMGLDYDKMADSNPNSVDAKTMRSPNRTYLVPKMVGRILLDESSIPSDFLKYSDIIRLFLGIQSYGASNGESQPWGQMVPKVEKILPNVYGTGSGRELTGRYLRVPMQPSGQSVWSLLSSYVNSPVDEMYTALKINPGGYVSPSIVVRQTPFNTNYFAQNCGFPTTAFMDLPRWKIDEGRIYNYNYGVSDVVRCNYISYDMTDQIGATTNRTRVLKHSESPYITDSADICRNGLRQDPNRRLTANFFESNMTQKEKPFGRWQQLMADILMDGHLKCNGTLTCAGIQEPICEGDNCEFEDMVFHIESVTHAGSISPNGGKNWTTSMQLTCGVKSKVNSEGEFIYINSRAQPERTPPPPKPDSVFDKFVDYEFSGK